MTHLHTAAAIATALLAGCASAPTQPAGSEALRTRLTALQADPQQGQHWLSFAEAYHHHQLQQKDENCPICTVAHQAPALLNTPQILQVTLHVAVAPAIVFAQPRFQFVFPSGGRSPPLL